MDLKLSQQLVMTPQLQLAIKLLGTPTTELGALLAAWCADHPGTLAERAPGEPNPVELESDEDGATWAALAEPPEPRFTGAADVWIFGNPPQVRANAGAVPRLVAVGGDRGAAWILRALRQRAKTYETVVRAVVAMRPQLATSLEPAALEPVAIRAIAEAIGMHESTVSRVGSAARFHNLHGVIAFVPGRAKLGFSRLE
jgi:RNA polymerase sigma-54 factor